MKRATDRPPKSCGFKVKSNLFFFLNFKTLISHFKLTDLNPQGAKIGSKASTQVSAAQPVLNTAPAKVKQLLVC